MMGYFPLIELKAHTGRQVRGRDYFSQLNDVRVAIKHKGIFPNPKYWYRVGEKTWDYISEGCQEYLGTSLEDLDKSSLISDSTVKEHYDEANKAFADGDYRRTLEQLGIACAVIFDLNNALRNLTLGSANAEDAIKLAGFGVRANDYLALQQFIPEVILQPDRSFIIHWKQYGHHANWTAQNASFAMRAFLELVLRIQEADWIPGPYAFHLIYDYKTPANDDTVNVFRIRKARSLVDSAAGDKELFRVLKKGESLRYPHIETNPISIRLSKYDPGTIVLVDENPVEHLVQETSVRITCVPKDDSLMRQHFPNLDEIPYRLSNRSD